MKMLLMLLSGIAVANGNLASAQQIPAAPPADWSLSIRAFGTTDRPGRDWLHISLIAHANASATISAERPVYDDRGIMIADSPRHEAKLTEKEREAFYQAARSLILDHRIGSAPQKKIKDGGSVEVTLSSFDKKISVTFDHNSFENSEEFAELLSVLQKELPEGFRIR